MCPGHKGVSDAYRTGWERIWGKRGVGHTGSGVFSVPMRPDSRRLEYWGGSGLGSVRDAGVRDRS